MKWSVDVSKFGGIGRAGSAGARGFGRAAVYVGGGSPRHIDPPAAVAAAGHVGSGVDMRVVGAIHAVAVVAGNRRIGHGNERPI